MEQGVFADLNGPNEVVFIVAPLCGEVGLQLPVLIHYKKVTIKEIKNKRGAAAFIGFRLQGSNRPENVIPEDLIVRVLLPDRSGLRFEAGKQDPQGAYNEDGAKEAVNPPRGRPPRHGTGSCSPFPHYVRGLLSWSWPAGNAPQCRRCSYEYHALPALSRNLRNPYV